MSLGTGSYRIGGGEDRLLVRTSRTGLGARAGHDLTIEMTAWTGTVTVDAEDPARSTVLVEVDVGSFAVRSGSGGVKPLTNSDRADIERTAREKILHADRHPKITFRSNQVAGTPESLVVNGELTITGVTNPVSVHATVTDDGRLWARTAIVQSRWGIKPYSAFFGALKVADEVAVEVDAVVTPS
ncbi:MAG TPA: YceI family protein [Amycolatopsis sp.]|nr:YceI family protein [Amycolatopsis sp.]